MFSITGFLPVVCRPTVWREHVSEYSGKETGRHLFALWKIFH